MFMMKLLITPSMQGVWSVAYLHVHGQVPLNMFPATFVNYYRCGYTGTLKHRIDKSVAAYGTQIHITRALASIVNLY